MNFTNKIHMNSHCMNSHMKNTSELPYVAHKLLKIHTNTYEVLRQTLRCTCRSLWEKSRRLPTNGTKAPPVLRDITPEQLNKLFNTVGCVEIFSVAAVSCRIYRPILCPQLWSCHTCYIRVVRKCVCPPVCYHIFCHHAERDNKRPIQRGWALHWLDFNLENFVKVLYSRVMSWKHSEQTNNMLISTGLPRLGLLALCIWKHKKSQQRACIDSNMLSTSPCQALLELLAEDHE